MNIAEITRIAIGALMGLAVSTGFLLALFIGFLVIAGFTKHRGRSRRSAIVRNIAETARDRRHLSAARRTARSRGPVAHPGTGGAVGPESVAACRLRKGRGALVPPRSVPLERVPYP